MEPLSLNVAQLRLAVGRLLDAIEHQLGDEVTFGVDHYWNVPNTAAYDPHSQPELDMGQVSDDVKSVRDFSATSVDEPVAIWHECEHIAGVFRAIAKTDLT